MSNYGSAGALPSRPSYSPQKGSKKGGQEGAVTPNSRDAAAQPRGPFTAGGAEDPRPPAAAESGSSLRTRHGALRPPQPRPTRGPGPGRAGGVPQS